MYNSICVCVCVCVWGGGGGGGGGEGDKGEYYAVCGVCGGKGECICKTRLQTR